MRLPTRWESTETQSMVLDESDTRHIFNRTVTVIYNRGWFYYDVI